MDNYVFCLAQKKAAAKMAKELNDVMTYCPERKTTVLDKFGLSAAVSSNFCVMSEIAEVTSAMLDSKMVAVLSKFPEALESIHFSDQYTGVKPPEDQVSLFNIFFKRILAPSDAKLSDAQTFHQNTSNHAHYTSIYKIYKQFLQ